MLLWPLRLTVGTFPWKFSYSYLRSKPVIDGDECTLMVTSYNCINSQNSKTLLQTNDWMVFFYINAVKNISPFCMYVPTLAVHFSFSPIVLLQNTFLTFFIPYSAIFYFGEIIANSYTLLRPFCLELQPSSRKDMRVSFIPFVKTGCTHGILSVYHICVG